MEIADKELIAEFVVESQEGLAHVEQQMLAIEAAGSQADVEQVNAVFRTMHSIKGAAGFLGLEQIGNLAHRLEELLNHMRNREVVPASELVTTLLSAADCMKDLLDSVDDSNEADISLHLEQMAGFLPGNQRNVEDALQPVTPATSHGEVVPAAEPLSDAVREFLIECYDNLEQMDRDLLALEQDPSSTQLIRGIFRTMHTIKGGAGFLGLTGLEFLAHAAENLLGKLRDGSLSMTADITGALLAAVDQCREGLQAIENPANSASFQPDSVIERLNLVNGGTANSAPSKIPAAAIQASDEPTICKPVPPERKAVVAESTASATGPATTSD